MLSTYAKARLVGYLEQITGLGMKTGIPVFAVAAGYLIAATFGRNIRHLDKLAQADRVYFLHSLDVATMAMAYSAIVVVASIILRMFLEEMVGQVLSLLGALLYFGSPSAFMRILGEEVIKVRGPAGLIVGSFCAVGAICLLPGLVLVVRDCILRIWRGLSVKRLLEYRWGDEEERRLKHRMKRMYGACWDMAYCRGFVRDVCPAFKTHKSCWQIKVGCYCDEQTILLAIAGRANDNEHYRGILHSLGLDKSAKSLASARAKRARCRRCAVYSEHQRQKYRILSPMVFPAVGLAFYLFYGPVFTWVWNVMETADRFLNFLAHSSLSGYNFASDGRVVTIMAIVWLIIISISYSLRALEYLIFDLQV